MKAKYIALWQKIAICHPLCHNINMWKLLVILVVINLFMCLQLLFHDRHHSQHHLPIKCDYALDYHGSNIRTMWCSFFPHTQRIIYHFRIIKDPRFFSRKFLIPVFIWQGNHLAFQDNWRSRMFFTNVLDPNFHMTGISRIIYILLSDSFNPYLR